MVKSALLRQPSSHSLSETVFVKEDLNKFCNSMYFIYSNITLKYLFRHSMCFSDHKLTKYMYFCNIIINIFFLHSLSGTGTSGTSDGSDMRQ